MHVPDGFLNAATSATTGILSLGTVSMALRHASQALKEKVVPLAGITAAFVFAAQMFNFPVAAGTTGHLLGGALAAILLGPSVGALVVTVVVVVQAFAFADGGLTALGTNILNMAIIPAYGGFGVFALLRKVFPRSTSGVIAATGLSAWLSVVMAAAAFSIQWLFGATAPIAFDTVFGAMVGVHLVIGIGEGIISALAMGAVMASRPDLVHGAADLTRDEVGDRRPVKTRTFVLGGLLTALMLAGVVSQFTAGDPDGLERVAIDTGIADGGGEPLTAGLSLFADYATRGIGNEQLSLVVAGVAGVLITLAVAGGVWIAIRRASQPGREHRA